MNTFQLAAAKIKNETQNMHINLAHQQSLAESSTASLQDVI